MNIRSNSLVNISIDEISVLLPLNIIHMFKADNWLSVYNGAIFDIVTNFNQPELTNQSSSIVTDISRTFVYLAKKKPTDY